MSQMGTREHLRQWLQVMMGMTYTKYSHLPTASKLDIMKKYGSKGKGKKNESGQSDPAQEGASPTIS